MVLDYSQQQVLQILEEKVVALANAGELNFVCANPPITTSAKMGLTERKAPLVPFAASNRFSLSDNNWPELGLVASRFPIIGFVLEGEADICIGVTQARASQIKALNKHHGLHVLALSAGSVFAIPAEVPFGDSSRRPHWEREAPETARSRILWLKLLPAGAVLHICSSRGLKHTHSDAMLIQNRHLSVLTQVLIESAEGHAKAQEVVSACLLALLHSLKNELATHRHVTHFRESTHVGFQFDWEELAPGPDTSHAALQRALLYIRSHMVDHISVAQIASHAYVSEPKLKRLFRSELNTSVMKYVMQLRLDEAKSLLLNSGLSVQGVSEICGFRHRSHFTRVFIEAVGQSPRAFRLQQRPRHSVTQ